MAEEKIDSGTSGKMKFEKAELREMYEKLISRISPSDIIWAGGFAMLSLLLGYIAIEMRSLEKQIKEIEKNITKTQQQRKEGMISFNEWGFVDNLRAKGSVQIKLEDIDFDSDLDIVMYDSTGHIRTYENKMPINLKPEQERVLEQLTLRLKADGYDISRQLKDPRFKYYRDIRKLLYGGEEISESQHKKNLDAYVKKYFKDASNFMMLHQAPLIKAWREYNVDPWYIVSLLNKESLLGKGKGVREVFSTLVSIYLDFPKSRHARFNAYEQLKALLDLSKKENRDVFSYKGSFMAALEIPQSLPVNVPIYGVDFDNDGKIDLATVPDAIGFVANYLSKAGFGWSKRRAIYSYNHSESYCDYIIALAKPLEKEWLRRKGLWDKYMIKDYAYSSASADKLNVHYSNF